MVLQAPKDRSAEILVLAVKTPLFTTAEVLSLAGVTAKNIADWHREQLIESVKRSRIRLYTAEQAIVVGVVAALRRLGVSRKKTRAAIRWLRDEEHLLAVLDGILAGYNFWFATDGRTHIVCEANEKMPEMLELYWGDGKDAVAVVRLSEIGKRVMNELHKKLFGEQLAEEGGGGE